MDAPVELDDFDIDLVSLLLDHLQNAYKLKAIYRNVKHGIVEVDLRELKMCVDNLKDIYIRRASPHPDSRTISTFDHVAAMYDEPEAYIANKYDPNSFGGKVMLYWIGNVDCAQFYIDLVQYVEAGFQNGVSIADMCKECIHREKYSNKRS